MASISVREEHKDGSSIGVEGEALDVWITLVEWRETKKNSQATGFSLDVTTN